MAVSAGISFGSLGCVPPDSEVTLPSEIRREDYAPWLDTVVLGSLRLPHVEHYTLHALDGRRVGENRFEIRRESAASQDVLVVENRREMTAGDFGRISDTHRWVFAARAPYQLRYAEAVAESPGERHTTRVVRSDVAGLGPPIVVVSHDGGEATNVTDIDLGPSSYSFLDVAVPLLWMGGAPDPGFRLEAREPRLDPPTFLNSGTLSLDNVAYVVGPGPAPGPMSSTRDARASLFVRVDYESPDAPDYDLEADSRGRLVRYLLPGFLEARRIDDERGEPVSVEADARESRFYLPDELPSAPRAFWRAKAASIMVCASTVGCGSGAFVSDEGHLLTAAHLVTRMDGSPDSSVIIPEFIGLGTIRPIHVDAEDDFALLKLDLAGGTRAPFHCIPAQPAEPVPRTEVWAIGFPHRVSPPGSR